MEKNVCKSGKLEVMGLISDKRQPTRAAIEGNKIT